MSASAIRNGIITTIVDYGAWSGEEVSSCDFGLMTFNASCVVLEPGPATLVTPISYGDGTRRDKHIRHNIYGRVFIKDPGSATLFLSYLWKAHDDIFNSIHSDDTFNGSCQAGMLESIGVPTDTFITDGNTDFRYVEFSIVAEEYTQVSEGANS
jgi:hypothetical protein